MTAFIYSALVIVSGLVVYFNVSGKLPDDSLIEEVVEEAIEEVIDFDIDLSPDSDE